MLSLILHGICLMKRTLQNRDAPQIIPDVWALLDLIEEEDMTNRLDKVEEKVSRLLLAATALLFELCAQ